VPTQNGEASGLAPEVLHKRLQTAGIEVPFPQRDVSVSVTDAPGEPFVGRGPSARIFRPTAVLILVAVTN